MITRRHDSNVNYSGLAWILLLPIIISSCSDVKMQADVPDLNYEVSMEAPADGSMHVVLECRFPGSDTVLFKMPEWMPGYYQIMDYSDEVSNFEAAGSNGRSVAAFVEDDHTWKVVPGKNRTFTISYDIRSGRRFVACNYVDTAHAYIIPAATFMYPAGYIHAPVRVRVKPYNQWNDIATGLKPVEGKKDEFIASGFDILYDCPILTGDLDELTPFTVNGIPHRFVTWNAGEFDGRLLMSDLKRIVEASASLMGEIPYSE